MSVRRRKLPASMQTEINRIALGHSQNIYWLKRAGLVAAAWKLLDDGHSQEATVAAIKAIPAIAEVTQLTSKT